MSTTMQVDGSLVHRYYDPATGQFLSADPMVAESGQPYSYAADDPVNAIDPNGLDCGIFSVVCGAYDATAGGVKSITSDVGHGARHLADNAATEVTSHWRGLAKIGILSVAVVGGIACAAATVGVCGSLAFSVGGLELSGGAIALGLAAGAAEGAADYALDCGHHSLTGYLSNAGLGALSDAAFAGVPEELVFGGLGEGAHAAQLGPLGALRNVPSYLYSVLK